MSATMIVLATPAQDGQDALQSYSAGTQPLFKAAGAQAPVRFKMEESVLGSELPKVVVKVDFPSADAIRGFFDSPEYKKLIPLRYAAFSDIRIMICNAA